MKIRSFARKGLKRLYEDDKSKRRPARQRGQAAEDAGFC
jgi:hypothetical protein